MHRLTEMAALAAGVAIHFLILPYYFHLFIEIEPHWTSPQQCPQTLPPHPLSSSEAPPSGARWRQPWRCLLRSLQERAYYEQCHLSTVPSAEPRGSVQYSCLACPLTGCSQLMSEHSRSTWIESFLPDTGLLYQVSALGPLPAWLRLSQDCSAVWGSSYSVLLIPPSLHRS